MNKREAYIKAIKYDIKDSVHLVEKTSEVVGERLTDLSLAELKKLQKTTSKLVEKSHVTYDLVNDLRN